MDPAEDEEVFWHFNTNTFAVPDDAKLRLAYSVYKPSKETERLKSEQGRTIFAEAFIERPELGTLADLAVRALVKAEGDKVNLLVQADPSKHRIHLNSISEDLPIEDVFHIDDVDFWKRVVLSKPENKSLVLKGNEFDWKGKGLSIKFTELVEECPAEYWPEEKMAQLALQIRQFVKEIHIKKLKSLHDRAFAHYLLRDSDTDKSDTTDVSSTTQGASDEPEELEEFSNKEATDLENVEDEADETSDREKQGMREVIASSDELDLSEEADDEMSEMPILEKYTSKKPVQVSETEKRRADRRERRMAQEERRRKRAEKLEARAQRRNPPPPSKKAQKFKSMFDIPLPEESDEDAKIPDQRNPAKYLRRLRNYKYPPEHCHHVDLRFLRFFTNLVDFSIRFQPPELGSHYHERHFKFSYDDVRRLAEGIRELASLRSFRLYNSRMDGRKLEILALTLKHMLLETIDFSNDELKDDCGPGLYDLFTSSSSIKNLELKGNFLSKSAMRFLGISLTKYSGQLEYLGLSNNPRLGGDALHELSKAISPTKQVTRLDLSGIKIPEQAIVCCVADELVRKHAVLKQLDLVAVPMSWKAGEELIKALQINMQVTRMDCRGCDLDFQQEFEIDVCLRRNRYIEENPYIGDTSKTTEEIEKFVNRVKQPIILKAREAAQARKECFENRPDIAERFSYHSLPEISLDEKSLSVQSVRTHQTVKTIVRESEDAVETQVLEIQRLSQAGSIAYVESNDEPFIFEPNSFNREEFFRHVEFPGPQNRYDYFKKKKKRLMCSYVDDV